MGIHMKRILLVATIYRCGEKIYPIIPGLCSKYEVDVFMFNQMSLNTPWEGDRDPRNDFREFCIKNNARVFQSKPYNFITKNHNSSSILEPIDIRRYDAVILDDNIAKSSWGSALVCQEARKNRAIVFACPHDAMRRVDFRKIEFDENSAGF